MQNGEIIQCQFSTKLNREMHFHQDVEIIYVLEGYVTVSFEEQKKILRKDDFLVINTNVRHRTEADNEVLVGKIVINYAHLIELFHGEPVYFLCNSAEETSESYEKMRLLIRQIFNYYHTDEGQGAILRNSIAYQLLYILTSEFIVKKGMSQYDSLRGISDERMNEILSYLMANYQEQITLQGLADKLYLSNAYLSKYIKKNFGLSFVKLLNNIRMEHAVSELLYSDKSVVKIAMDNGFPNLAGMNRAFREMYHTTPAEYRKEMMEKTEASDQDKTDRKVIEKVENYLASNNVDVNTVTDVSGVSISTDVRKYRTLKRNWNQMINVGSASDLLLYDCREQVRFLKEKLDFKYIRFWNLFSDDMMIQLDENKTKYNFTMLDKVFDFIVEIGAKPFIEMGFKTKEIYENILIKIVDIDNMTKFKMIEKNRIFLVEFVKHLVHRYGVAEVETWYVELEKNSVVKERVKNEEYINAFIAISQVFKTYVPNIKIGGAGLCLNYLESDFEKVIVSWKKMNLKMDFITLYSYPYIMNEDMLEAGRNAYSSDESFLYNQISEAKRICRTNGLEIPELFVTEWSSTLSNRNPLNDSCFKAAYVMKNLMQNMDEADLIGYWVATDLFSNYYDTHRILYGGCGLISRDGIQKAVFYAYSFLNSLYNRLIAKSKNVIITGDGRDAYSICCHNYKHFNFRYYLQDENEMPFDRLSTLYENNESLQIQIRLENVENGTYLVKKHWVNQGVGDIQSEWGKVGYYSFLSKEEIEYYKQVVQPGMHIEQIQVTDHVLEIETTLLSQEIDSIQIALL